YPSGTAYQSIQIFASSGQGSAASVTGYDSLIAKVSWSSSWDRTLSFTANTASNLTYLPLTCTLLETGAETSTPPTQRAYLCPVRGKQSFKTPITDGTAGTATVTIVSKQPIAMPVIQRQTVLEGPQGPQGDPGIGDPGPEGPTGPQGPAGASYHGT